MDFMCRLLICSWLVASWWNEYRRTKRDQVKAQGQIEVASEPRSNGLNQLTPFASHEATCNSSW